MWIYQDNTEGNRQIKRVRKNMLFERIEQKEIDTQKENLTVVLSKRWCGSGTRFVVVKRYTGTGT